MKPLKIGIIASGFTGQKHADALRRIAGLEVVAMADPHDPDLAGKAAALGIPHHYKDYVQMAQSHKLDVVHNCTPNAMHYEVSRFFLQQGVAVYSEKPLAVSVQQAEALVRLAKENGVAAAVNFNYRNNAMVQEMRERVASGSAGRCFLVHGTYIQDWMMLESDYNWRLESEIGGVSRAVADIGSHWFDTIQVILGKRIAAVNANLFVAHPFRQKPQARLETFAQAAGGPAERVEVASEDGGFVVLRFEDGTPGMVVLSQVSGGYKNAFAVSVDCAKYSMRWNQETPDFLVLGDREGQKKLYASAGGMTGAANDYALLSAGHPMGWSDALYNGLKRFYASIWDGSYTNPKQPYATFADGLYAMKLVDACLASNQSGSWVTVKEGDLI